MIIYLIFSEEGYEEVKPSLFSEQAILWVNNDLLSEAQLLELKQQAIEVNIFPEMVDGSHEKSIMQALIPIENQHPNAEILVEYL